MKALQLEREEALRTLLLAGALLRVLVFFFLHPSSPDDHVSVVAHIVDHGELPAAGVYSHSFHPPLYHLLAAPFFAVGGPKGAQLFSLLTSLVTLWLLQVAIRDARLLRSALARNIAMGMAAFVPSFVVFSLYVSNDTLAYLLGALTFILLRRLGPSPSMKELIVLGVVMGLGLSTKATFLALMPPVATFVALRTYRHGGAVATALRCAAIVMLLTSALGSYKFIENMVVHGKPVVHNVHPSWADAQRPTYVGPSSLVDVNIFKLMNHPTLSEHTRYSFPLLLYGTFWYKYVPYENNFSGCSTKLRAIGSGLYAFGLVPTLLALLGVLSVLRQSLSSWRELLGRATPSAPAADDELGSPLDTETRIYRLHIVFALLMSVAIAFASVASFDVWSSLQSRIFFAGYFGVMFVTGAGIDVALRRSDQAALIISRLVSTVFALCVVYFVTEFWLTILYWRHGPATADVLESMGLL
jgi:hypothetical protein